MFLRNIFYTKIYYTKVSLHENFQIYGIVEKLEIRPPLHIWLNLHPSMVDSCIVCMQPSVGDVVVDPATKDLVIAMAHSDPNHPPRHAVMMFIDSVAKQQGGGAWCSDSEGKNQCFTIYYQELMSAT